ncbi:hypothetical protein ACOMHN_061896 [Nucella lapillus]
MGREVTPDCGYAWVVLAASVGCNYLSGVLVYFVGVIHVELLNEFRGDVTSTAWAGSLYSSLQMLAAPLASWLVHHYSCRVSVVIGGALLCVGFVTSAFVTSVLHLVFTYGLIAGTGLGLTYSPSLMMITFYFKRFRGLASGISVSGCAVGILTGSLLTQTFIDMYSLDGAFLIIAGLGLQSSVFGMLYRPTQYDGTGSLKRKKNPNYDRQVSWKACEESQTPCLLAEKNPSNPLSQEILVDAENPSNSLSQGILVDAENPSNSLSQGYLVDAENPSNSLSQGILVGTYRSPDPLSQGILVCSEDEDLRRVDAENQVQTVKDLEEKTTEFKQQTSLTCSESHGPAQNTKTVSAEADGEEEERTEDSELLRNEQNEVSISPGTKTSERKPSPGTTEISPRSQLHKVLSQFKAVGSLMKNWAFLLHCASVFFAGFNMSGVYLHLPEYARTHGTQPTQAAALFVGVGVFSFLSRIGNGLLLTSPRVNGLVLSVVLMGACGLACCLFPWYSLTYVRQMTFASLFGLSTGGFFTLINVLTVQLVGFQFLTTAYGVLIFTMGVGYVAGPPLSGRLACETINPAEHSAPG